MRFITRTILVVAIPAYANAQEWNAEIQGGRIRSALDPASRGTVTVAGGISFADPTTALRLTAGIPAQPESPYWASVGAYKRAAVKSRGLIAGIDLTGQGYLFQDRNETEPGSLGGLFDPISAQPEKKSGHALAGQAMPVVGFDAGPIQLHARAGMSYYTVSMGNQSHDRTVPLGDIELTFQPTASFAISPVVRRYQPQDENASTFAGLSAAIAAGRASLWANAGQWVDVDTSSTAKTAWAAGASIPVTDRARFNASARHDGFDPLYLNPSQTSWSVGFSVLLNRPAARSAAPVPAAYDDGIATIRLPVSQSSSTPSVAGDFNKWNPAPMEREGKYWTYRAPLPKGVYNFAFVSADGKWFVPDKYPGRKDDGMGGHVAVLVVR